MFKASSKSAVGKTIFYCFEISALVVAILMFVLAIYNASVSSNFMVFLKGLESMILDTFTLFALGKIIDLLFCRKEAKCCDKSEEEEKFPR